ncbi:hypothetical protein DQ04_03871070, partial [Trypanosoma grayi]|uniref:hypothetical protein n=1 Tax=Trypanosoma grayi TaxID=71804 RepID=UPI0004F45058
PTAVAHLHLVAAAAETLETAAVLTHDETARRRHVVGPVHPAPITRLCQCPDPTGIPIVQITQASTLKIVPSHISLCFLSFRSHALSYACGKYLFVLFEASKTDGGVQKTGGSMQTDEEKKQKRGREK